MFYYGCFLSFPYCLIQSLPVTNWCCTSVQRGHRCAKGTEGQKTSVEAWICVVIGVLTRGIVMPFSGSRVPVWKWVRSTMEKSWTQLCILYHTIALFLVSNGSVAWFVLTYNSTLPEQNGRHFADDMFKCILLNEKLCFFIQMSLKFFS